jgi:hypothetical protein
MQAVHEFGHVTAAVATGGKVTKIVLHPLAISRTDVAPNPQPLIVVWAGPVIGCLAPLVVWLGVQLAARAYAQLMVTAQLARFFLGFCLLANGLYLGVGSFDGVGDAGNLVRLHTPIWCLWLFGVITVPLGLLAWHKLGGAFGLGANGKVIPRTAIGSAILLATTLLLEVSLSSRI